jgi:hypothetical protein
MFYSFIHSFTAVLGMKSRVLKCHEHRASSMLGKRCTRTSDPCTQGIKGARQALCHSTPCPQAQTSSLKDATTSHINTLGTKFQPCTLGTHILFPRQSRFFQKIPPPHLPPSLVWSGEVVMDAPELLQIVKTHASGWRLLRL